MTEWLIDASALSRLPKAVQVEEWMSRTRRGLIRIATVTRLEVGYSARSAEEHRVDPVAPPIMWMPVEYLTPTMEDRAYEVQGLLADRGQHRAPSVADLLLAATAEGAGLTLLHVDEDFELIAEVTGQPIERLEVSV